MSERIDEILEVLSFARLLAHATTQDGRRLTCADIRRRAVGVVAQLRGIDPTTVSDKFRRQLHPHIVNTATFDAALGSWLYAENPALENALYLHTVSDQDRLKIRAFFATKVSSQTP